MAATLRLFKTFDFTTTSIIYHNFIITLNVARHPATRAHHCTRRKNTAASPAGSTTVLVPPLSVGLVDSGCQFDGLRLGVNCSETPGAVGQLINTLLLDRMMVSLGTTGGTSSIKESKWA